MNKTAKRVADWLNSLNERPNVYLADIYFENAVPVLVTIGKQQWYGARYDRVFIGPKKPDRRDWLYLLGALPKAYLKSKRLAFQAEVTGKKDWYIASYNSLANLRKYAYPKPGDCIPFGDYFQMSLWNMPNGKKIDWGLSRPYKRLSMTIQNL